MDITYYMEQHLDLLADIKSEVQTLRNETIKLAEAIAGVRAEVTAPATAAIAKAQESAKAEPAPTPASVERAEPSEPVDPAELVRLAAALSKTAGKDKVKATIAKFAPSIKDVAPFDLPALKAAMEALA